MTGRSPSVPPGTVCGTFGCDEPAVVRTTRAHEWFPGWYCADHGAESAPARTPSPADSDSPLTAPTEPD